MSTVPVEEGKKGKGRPAYKGNPTATLFGPPRGYWCFGYEAFNKIIKAGAQRTNWRDTTYSIMQYWSVRSARAMLREKSVVTQTV